MSESAPCVHAAFKKDANDQRSGLETEGLTFLGQNVFCDRASCSGSYEVEKDQMHGVCNTHGVPDEGTDQIETVSEELSDALVQRERVPNPKLIRLGLVAVGAAEMLLEPFFGDKYRTKILERLFNA
jgi:hypothetical protein